MKYLIWWTDNKDIGLWSLVFVAGMTKIIINGVITMWWGPAYA